MIIKRHWFDSAVPEIPGREVQLLLPDSYDASAPAYPLLVMHDGQNCLDEDGYGHGGWQLHRVLDRLIDSGEIPPLCALLVPCHPDQDGRMEEYSPAPWFYPGNQRHYQGRLAAHDHWLLDTVLPALQMRYRLSQDPAQCAIGGSSMGGLASLATALMQPVFGKVLCMSAPLVIGAQGMVPALLAAADTGRRPDKIYLDAGTEFEKVPGDFSDDTRQTHQLLLEAGYRDGVDVQCAVFEGDAHNEACWRRRLPQALKFLFG